MRCRGEIAESMQTDHSLDSAKAAFTKGLDQLRQGDYRGALESFDLAVRLNPEDAGFYGNRCVARHRLGDAQGAIADCKHAAALFQAQGNMKDYQYALKMLEKLQK
jgi:Flp pilus assembly protein TadD